MDYNTDEYKKFIEEMFEVAEKSAKNPKPTHRMSEIVQDMADGEDVTAYCRRKALDELETIRLAFIEFQERIENLVLSDYLAGQVESFAQYAVNIAELVEQDFDETQMSSNDMVKYKKLKRLKSQMFSSLYNKYKKK